jgi:uncharacterized membrane protein
MRLVLEVVLIILVGWVAGAELGSWCCVQPVLAKLPYEHYVGAERAMLRTFGRLMPVLMPLSGLLAIIFIFVSRAEGGLVWWLRVAAAACIAITIITTVVVNVPINNRTAEWSLNDDPAEWQQMRTRWHAFQGLRGGLYFAAFILLVIASVALRLPVNQQP